ncbi:hypothetical protein AB0A05_07585 [Streptomyces sp. NPDC046374]|uniref:hypothetical protein n=1 Tax=Streptomyces sp. NPDC046374 TaxID=3154917 RepID=UPI0033ED5162
MSTNPTPATGPEAADRLHFTDPRVNPLARAAYSAQAAEDRPWHTLDWGVQHTWRTGARDWLRAAVHLGLLPLVVPSTGQALAAVPLDVVPGDGRPRPGSRGRAEAFRDAADAIKPERFGWGGTDHHDAWTEAGKRLREIADDERNSAGDILTADQVYAALVRVEAWADQLDDTAQRKAGRLTATDPVADVLRGLLDGGRNGEAPA